MKTITTIFLILCLLATPAFAGGEMKEVCKEVTDKKTGKTKQECKKVKVHQKLEGTKVPEKK